VSNYNFYLVSGDLFRTSKCSSSRRLVHEINLMEAIPLCDIIEVYINIYLRLYTTIFHNSE